MSVESIERITESGSLPARIVSVGSEAVVLQPENGAELRLPRTAVSPDAKAGDTVHLRALTKKALADESGEIARMILERFLN